MRINTIKRKKGMTTTMSKVVLSLIVLFVMIIIAFKSDRLPLLADNFFHLIDDNNPFSNLMNNEQTNSGKGLESKLLYVNPTSFSYGEDINLRYQVGSNSSSDRRLREVVIEVFDINGDLKAEKIFDRRPARNYTDPWDGTNNLGQEVSSGIYFVRINIEGYTSDSTKIVKLPTK